MRAASSHGMRTPKSHRDLYVDQKVLALDWNGEFVPAEVCRIDRSRLEPTQHHIEVRYSDGTGFRVYVDPGLGGFIQIPDEPDQETLGKVTEDVLAIWRSWAESALSTRSNQFVYVDVVVNAKLLLWAVCEIEAGRLGSGEKNLHAEQIESWRSLVADMLKEAEGKPTGSLIGAVCCIRELHEDWIRRGRECDSLNALVKRLEYNLNEVTAQLREKEKHHRISEECRAAAEKDLKQVCAELDWYQDLNVKHIEKEVAIQEALRSAGAFDGTVSDLENVKWLIADRHNWKARSDDLARELDDKDRKHKVTCDELLAKIENLGNDVSTYCDSDITHYNALIGIANRLSMLISDDFDHLEHVDYTEDGISNAIDLVCNRLHNRIGSLQTKVAELDGTLMRQTFRMLRLLDRELDIDWDEIEQAEQQVDAVDAAANGD